MPAGTFRRFGAKLFPAFSNWLKRPKLETPKIETMQAKAALSLFNPSKKKIELPNGNLIERHSFVFNRDGTIKGIIVKAHLSIIEKWLYYPRPEHFPIFEAAAKKVKGGGPAQEFPGAVGTISILKAVKVWEISVIQAHFIQGKPASLTRALATQYGGWRQRLLDAIFKEAEKTGKAVSIRLQNPKPDSFELSQYLGQIQLFKERAEKNGFLVVNEYGNFFIAKKRK